MKRIILTTLLLLSATCWLSAQNTRTNGGGPATQVYYSNIYDLIGDDNEHFTMLKRNPSYNRKGDLNEMFIYDKESNTVRTQGMLVPSNATLISGKETKDGYFFTMMTYVDKKEVHYQTVQTDKTSGNILNATNVQNRLTFEIDARGDVFQYAATSKDGSKQAVLLIGVDKRSNASAFNVFIYDGNGEEIAYQHIAPEVYGNSFSISDFQVTDDGNAVILVHGQEVVKKEIESSAVQLIICNQDGAETQAAAANFGIFRSMKLCLLENGNVFVGGYYARDSKELTTGFFNYIYDTRTQEFSEGHVTVFSDLQRPQQTVDFVYGTRKFVTNCVDIHELPDGTVMMVGEHRALVIVYSNGGNAYHHTTGDLVYQKFDKEGATVTAQMLPKEQFFGSYSYIGGSDCHATQLRGVGISFSTFVSGNDVYALYYDNAENINSINGGQRALIRSPKKNCVMMAKLEDDGPDKETVFLSGKSQLVLHHLWDFDGKNVYFGMYSKKKGTVEHFEL